MESVKYCIINSFPEPGLDRPSHFEAQFFTSSVTDNVKLGLSELIIPPLLFTEDVGGMRRFLREYHLHYIPETIKQIHTRNPDVQLIQTHIKREIVFCNSPVDTNEGFKDGKLPLTAVYMRLPSCILSLGVIDKLVIEDAREEKIDGIFIREDCAFLPNLKRGYDLLDCSFSSSFGAKNHPVTTSEYQSYDGRPVRLVSPSSSPFKPSLSRPPTQLLYLFGVVPPFEPCCYVAFVYLYLPFYPLWEGERGGDLYHNLLAVYEDALEGGAKQNGDLPLGGMNQNEEEEYAPPQKQWNFGVVEDCACLVIESPFAIFALVPLKEFVSSPFDNVPALAMGAVYSIFPSDLSYHVSHDKFDIVDEIDYRFWYTHGSPPYEGFSSSHEYTISTNNVRK